MVRTIARRAFAALAWIYLAALGLQVFFAGMFVFDWTTDSVRLPAGSAVRAAGAAWLVLLLVLAACGGPPAVPAADASGMPRTSASAAPSLTPEPSASDAPSAAPDASATPAASPSAPAGSVFDVNVTLEVVADGLAVRTAPLISARVMAALAFNDATQAWTPTGSEARLNAGAIVLINLGPIVRDGHSWYRVHSLTTGNDPTAEIRWDADRDGEPDDAGWIAAAGTDGTPYVVSASERFPTDRPPLLLAAAAGIGPHQTQPFRASGQIGGDWALATQDEAPCLFEVTIQPIGVVLLSTGLEAAFDTGAASTDQGQALPDGEYWLQVEAGVPNNANAPCSWAFAIYQSMG